MFNNVAIPRNAAADFHEPVIRYGIRKLFILMITLHEIDLLIVLG
jgi:hypothetical protein